MDLWAYQGAKPKEDETLVYLPWMKAKNPKLEGMSDGVNEIMSFRVKGMDGQTDESIAASKAAAAARYGGK